MSDQSGNRLLDSLPGDERDRLVAMMEKTPLDVRDILAEPGHRQEFVYFPTDGIISIMTTLVTGHAVEAATVGWEGMAGVEVFLGGGGTDNVRLVVQVDGEAWRMDAGTFREESSRPGPLRQVMERFVRVFFVQTTQSAACNGLHSIEERFSKWLALISDWLDRDEFPLTHDFAAALLGVHRPSVTLAAGALQRSGIIDYRRGRVKVVDGDALREVACECYEVIRRAFDELAAPVPGDGPGAVRHLVAVLDGARAGMARSRAAQARAASLCRESAGLAKETSRLVRRARAIRAGAGSPPG